MPHEPPADAEVEGLLRVFGVGSLCQWDVVVFLYRHQTTLVGADYLALLLGYAIETIIAALDVLESLGLVDRSRVSQGARLYQFTTPAEPPRSQAFDRLLGLTTHREGRLLVCGRLRRDDRTPREGLATTPGSPAEVEQVLPITRQRVHSIEQEKGPCLKVI